MSELVDFLRARLDEDHERARFVQTQIAAGRGPETFEPWKLSWHDEYDLLCIEPERALAEVEAKRRIIDLHPIQAHEDVDESGDRPVCFWTTACPRCADSETDGWDTGWKPVCDTLCLLALPYADHPDYEPGWRL